MSNTLIRVCFYKGIQRIELVISDILLFIYLSPIPIATILLFTYSCRYNLTSHLTVSYSCRCNLTFRLFLSYPCRYNLTFHLFLSYSCRNNLTFHIFISYSCRYILLPRDIFSNLCANAGSYYLPNEHIHTWTSKNVMVFRKAGMLFQVFGVIAGSCVSL